MFYDKMNSLFSAINEIRKRKGQAPISNNKLVFYLISSLGCLTVAIFLGLFLDISFFSIIILSPLIISYPVLEAILQYQKLKVMQTEELPYFSTIICLMMYGMENIQSTLEYIYRNNIVLIFKGIKVTLDNIIKLTKVFPLSFVLAKPGLVPDLPIKKYLSRLTFSSDLGDLLIWSKSYSIEIIKDYLNTSKLMMENQVEKGIAIITAFSISPLLIISSTSFINYFYIYTFMLFESLLFSLIYLIYSPRPPIFLIHDITLSRKSLALLLLDLLPLMLLLTSIPLLLIPLIIIAMILTTNGVLITYGSMNYYNSVKKSLEDFKDSLRESIITGTFKPNKSHSFSSSLIQLKNAWLMSFLNFLKTVIKASGSLSTSLEMIDAISELIRELLSIYIAKLITLIIVSIIFPPIVIFILKSLNNMSTQNLLLVVLSSSYLSLIASRYLFYNKRNTLLLGIALIEVAITWILL